MGLSDPPTFLVDVHGWHTFKGYMGSLNTSSRLQYSHVRRGNSGPLRRTIIAISPQR
ncbi:uncharacterized protein METZ01_LOCUS234658, partial [marine metagenome]